MNDNAEQIGDVRRLLCEMITILDASPDALSTHYSALRDKSYALAVQVRTAALPEVWPCREAFIQEATGKKW